MEVKISHLLERIEHHEIVVPSFQREYEWNERRSSSKKPYA